MFLLSSVRLAVSVHVSTAPLFRSMRLAGLGGACLLQACVGLADKFSFLLS